MSVRLKIRILLLGCALTIIAFLLYKKVNIVTTNTGCYIRLEAMGSFLIQNELSDYTKWYDLLMKEDYTADTFKCPACKEKGKIGTYIINKNYKSIWGSSEEIVLVFEGEPGWNQYGDANEILPLHNRGCYVLFTDGDIKFVKKEDFGKLVWESRGKPGTGTHKK